MKFGSAMDELLNDMGELSTFGDDEDPYEALRIKERVAVAEANFSEVRRQAFVEEGRSRRSPKSPGTKSARHGVLYLPDEEVDYEYAYFEEDTSPVRDITNTYTGFRNRERNLISIDSASYRNEAIEEFVKEIQTEASKERLEKDSKYKLEKSTKKPPTKEGDEKPAQLSTEPAAVDVAPPTVVMPKSKKDRKKKNALVNALRNAGKLNDNLAKSDLSEEDAVSTVASGNSAPLADFAVSDSADKLEVTNELLKLKFGEMENPIVVVDCEESVGDDDNDFQTAASDSSGRCSTVNEFLTASSGSSPISLKGTTKNEKGVYHSTSKRLRNDALVGFDAAAKARSVRPAQKKNSPKKPSPKKLPTYVPDLRHQDYEYRPQDFPKL